MLSSGKDWIYCSKTSGDSQAPLSKLILFKSEMKVCCFFHGVICQGPVFSKTVSQREITVLLSSLYF